MLTIKSEIRTIIRFSNFVSKNVKTAKRFVEILSSPGSVITLVLQNYTRFWNSDGINFKWTL